MLPSWIKVTIVQLDTAAKSFTTRACAVRFCKYSTLAVYYDHHGYQLANLLSLTAGYPRISPNSKEGSLRLYITRERFQRTYMKDTLPSGVTVNLIDLNDRSDTVSTLEAKYHKKCRSYYSSCFKCLWEKMEKEVPCQLSLKKTEVMWRQADKQFCTMCHLSGECPIKP